MGELEERRGAVTSFEQLVYKSQSLTWMHPVQIEKQDKVNLLQENFDLRGNNLGK